MTDSSEEEEDYMSEAFLTKTMESDVRPGLVRSHKIARQIEKDAKKAKIDADNKKSTKPVRQLEVERREEGLSSAISSSNKGFAMLAKMGYKQGDSIGRSSTGIVEPISIQLKTDRGGLGRAEAIKQLEQYKAKLRKAKAENKDEESTTSISQFRLRMAQKTNNKQLEADLCKCQRACEKLDLDASIETPAMIWFWPIRKTIEPSETTEDPYDDKNEEKPKQERESSSDDDDDSNDEETKFRFGEFPDSDEDSEKSAEIKQVTEPFETIVSDKEEEGQETEPEYETSEKIEMLTNYLRTTYCYCHWCGVHYKDIDDMNDNCSGVTKDDH